MKVKIIILIFWLFATYSHAAYLTNVPITITQPDGTKIECFATGDEYYNWTHDKDGYTIVQDANTGYYCYAILNGDELTASPYVVGKIMPRSAQLTPNINISGEKMLEKRKAFMQDVPQRATPQNAGIQPRAAAVTGTVNNIVIYVRFADQTEFPADQSDYTKMFNTETSSMRNYFREVSYQKLDVISHFYPANNDTTILSYQDSHNRNYYCPYNPVTNPSGYTDLGSRATREHALVANAINFVENQIQQLSVNIDNDNDGKVDNVCLVARGNVETANAAESGGNVLWPHQWQLFGQTVTINGKIVWNFNFQIEERMSPLSGTGNGVLCHEMSHTLGIPDLYHSKAGYGTPVGPWDVMANDLNPPQYMNAHLKYKYVGWISSIPSITRSGTYTLSPSVYPTGNCYKIPISDSEYFLLEYRLKTGTFENSIPGSGLLIYRINESIQGNGGGTGLGGLGDEVYVFRPNGTLSADGNINNAHFSQNVGRTSFNHSTNPRCFLADGSPGGLNIQNIRENNLGTLSFDISFCDGTNISYSNTSYLPPLTKASNTIQTSGTVIVKNTDNVKFEAGNRVTLGGGFQVKLGGMFKINMKTCE